MKRLLLPLLVVTHAAAAAAVLAPGAALPALQLKDQHEKPVTIAPDTRLVFFAAEMGGSRMMSRALDALPAATLKDKNAVYIADISGMPAIFSTIVALPRLQQAGYRVGLVKDERQAASLPRKPGSVTVLKVESGRVRSVEFARDTQQIKSHLK